MSEKRAPTMRTDWMRCIALSDLKPNQKLVAYTIGQRMDGTGSAHPGFPRIAKESGLALSTVKRIRQQLEDAGFVSVRIGGGAGRSNVYSATIPSHVWDRLIEERSHQREETVPPAAQNGPTSGTRSTKEVHIEGSPSPYHTGDDPNCRCQICLDRGWMLDA